MDFSFFGALVLNGCCPGVFMIYSLDGVTGLGRVIFKFGICSFLHFLDFVVRME